MDASAEPIAGPASIRQAASRGVWWSIVRNWGGKMLSFLLAILLTRLLSPQEFGIASAVSLGLMLVPLVAEMGFTEAIIQRRNLKPSDLNLPFYLSATLSFSLATFVILAPGIVEKWTGLHGQSAFIAASAATIFITVPSAFQEAVYKRNHLFRDLALRGFASSIVGGIAALACALMGFGVWTFVVQAYVSTIINTVWIWRRPQWLPGRHIDVGVFREMSRFSVPILIQRLLDFGGSRIVDIIILSQLGLAAYGIYVIGSRLYLTLMQLLQGAFSDVSLSVLSGVAHDRDRLAQIYRKTISLSASTISPIFVLFSALSPEICDVLFGHKWDGVDTVGGLLLLMGAVHCVQYMNGPFLSARGKPELVLVTGSVRTAVQVAALLLVPAHGLTGITTIFVLATLAATPLSFTMTSRELGLGPTALARTLGVPVVLASASFLVVQIARGFLLHLDLSSFWQGTVLGALFVSCYVALLSVFDRARVVGYASIVLTAVQRRRRRA